MSNPAMPLAHIVDDDEAIRDALSWLFRTRNVAARAWASAEDFLAAWQPDWQGCIVLDIRMREMSGLECFDALLERGNTLPVIFLTGHGDVPMAVGALKKGAFDFLEKPVDDNALVDVVIRALATNARHQANQETQATVATRLAQLTPREHEVMQLVLAGKFNKVIADELNISMRTVEVHRSRVFEKMGVRSAVELAQLLSPRD
ncbi:DNA-binding response regulator [Zoogloea oryzae]|uniref:DNA-binding response regulator n=1 Tax=Zoogloea oryzae TaxID=310767 RepID=A0ABQ6F739_9RHOO|nr:response regulator [Zoogloea oryzae]GLT21047.1 DNA-binding response regulator [Zoogloea oryzae]